MKAVLLAGGLGTRMREETEFRPKPMVEVGGRPVLWHIMKILATQGIKDFIICAGYKSEYIKNYFSNYAATSLDFSVTLGDRESMQYFGSHDEFDWKVTVVDTGPETMTGGRIKRVESFLEGERFFCTYGDGIANVDIQALISAHSESGMIATMTTTQPYSRFGVVEVDQDGAVAHFREKPKMDDWVNIGYFILEPEVLKLIDDDSCVFEDGPLRKLAESSSLGAFKHEGFWQPMDTQRELQSLNEIWSTGNAPWKTWN